MQRFLDQQGPFQHLENARLIAALEGKDPSVDRLGALKELGRRRTPVPTELLASIAEAEAADRDLRVSAVVKLGQQGTARERQALEAALNSRDLGVVRRAAEVLGRIGDLRSLQALESIQLSGTPAAKSVAFARSLLSYRFSVNKHLLSRPRDEQLVLLNGERLAEVRVAPASPPEREGAVQSIRRSLVDAPLSQRSAISLRCGGSHLVVLPVTGSGAVGAVERLSKGPTIVAVVAKHSPGLDQYYLHEYFLANPGKVGTADVLGARTTGDVAHAGSLQLGGLGVTFSIYSTASPYSPPVGIAGLLTANYELLLERTLIQRNFDRTRQPVLRPREVDLEPD